MRLRNMFLVFFSAFMTLTAASNAQADEGYEHGFVTNGDVKIHYVTAGEGPLVVMLHGFPDFWLTWRDQIPAISRDHQVVAIDLRGFNESDKPEGVENYALDKLVADVEAVVKHFGAVKATVIGHDWGGMIAWSFAMQHPQMTERLVILNFNGIGCAHPQAGKSDRHTHRAPIAKLGAQTAGRGE